jgi:ribosomal-protein-alanine N-acetyltransferase
MADFPQLETPRLLLREIVAGDAPALFAVHGDAERMRWFGSDPLPDLAAADRLVAGFAAGRTLANPSTRWGLERRDRDSAAPGELIGSCGLFAWNRPWRKCSLGYELARQVEGQGLMQEALHAVLAWGFEQMALNRVEAQVHVDNAASLRLLGRLGFAVEGRLRQLGHWGGQFHDMWQLALLAHDWLAPEGALAQAALPEGSNFYAVLGSALSKRQIAEALAGQGWAVRRCARDDYELRSHGIELTLDGHGEWLLHGRVAAIGQRARRIVQVLDALGVACRAECYDDDGALMSTPG